MSNQGHLMWISITISLSLLSICELQLVSAQSTPSHLTDNTSFLPYSNFSLGIQIQYPSSWIEQQIHNQSSYILVVFSSPPGASKGTVSLIVGKMGLQNMSLQQYAETGINQLRYSFADFNLIMSNKTTVASGIPAYRVIFTYDQGGTPIKQMQVWTVSSNEFYILTYGSRSADYSIYLPLVERMIDSFKITKIAPMTESAY